MEPPIENRWAWTAIEDIGTDNFTPRTISRMKRWLLGNLVKAGDVISDYDFLNAFFTSVGCKGFESSCFEASYGYTFNFYSHKDSLEQAQADGLIEEDEEDFPSMSWLEYQARWATNALRPIDRYYVGYNLLESKASWGKNVIDDCTNQDQEEKIKQYLEEDEEIEDLARCPWLLWERASKRTKFDATAIMSLLSQLRRPGI